MSTTYTPKTGLGKPAHGDRNWDVPLLANIDTLEGFNALGALAVRRTEIPSASLNVDVAGGTYRLTNGQLQTYAGSTANAVTASTITFLWLDEAGALNSGAAYPAGSAIVRLAKVTAGPSTITSIADERTPWFTFGATQAANLFYAGPASGAAAAPTFRAIVAADLPTLDLVPAPAADVSFNSHKGTNAADPVNPQDLATKHYVDTAVASGTIIVGTTPVGSGTSGDLLYDNGGMLGQLGLAPGMGMTLAISGGNLTVGRTPLYAQACAAGGTTTFNLNNGDLQYCSLTGNTTIALSNVSNQPFTLILIQDATGSRTVTWFGTIRWQSGTAPTLTTTASKADTFTFIPLGGGNYLGFTAGQNA